MILADTSVWIDHLRREDQVLAACLSRREITMHPFVVGELALGPLPRRTQTLFFLDHLPSVKVAQPDEIRALIEARGLHNQGIGFIDANLLASVLISPGTELWTRDRSLRKVAAKARALSALT